ncbi:BTAD domain-containing putative transcriptional regulator [Amycolatopsis sp. NPDC049252]|uniref:AfsR/SARP family transcriptional regulator n=1 Tax=Amycolatopsis sp. NPDC049252 TaxID=3363933 RepID=UPI003714FCB8
MGGPRIRAILAALLLSAGSVVPVGAIVTAVWGARPPGTAAKQVRNGVSALRAALPGRPIETRAAGYLLPVAPDDLDVAVFERAARHSRLLLAAGEHRAAAECAGRALSLWCGPALGGLDCPGLAVEAARLEELRLDVTAVHVEAELATGDGRDLVGRLRTLTGAHPFREQFHRQLMVALHRSGRSLDALRSYDEYRLLLAEETGLDPGPELTRLRQAILTGGAGRAPATVRARQLPADVPDLVGRALEEDRLRTMLAPGRTAVVTGGPGIGKSALAVHVAWSLSDRFPDGQLYLTAHADLAVLLGDALSGLGVPPAQHPAGTSARAGLYRSLLAERRVLVLLDDVVLAHQAHALRPGTGGSAAVIVSARELLRVSGAQSLHLSPLDAAAASALLGCPHRPELTRLCGGNPAVLLAANRLAHLFPELGDRQVAECCLLDPDVHDRVRQRLELAGPDARAVFRRRSGTGAIDVDCTSDVGLLVDLADVGLIDAVGGGRYRIAGPARVLVSPAPARVPLS